MGRKKKSFIDKQNASTYHLVRRSQRDIELMDDDEQGKEGSVPKDFVLMPSPHNKKNYALDYQNNNKKNEQKGEEESGPEKQNKSAFQILGDKLRDYGLAESDYDYSQHTRTISNSGVFMSAPSSSSNNNNNTQRRGVKFDPTLDPRSWNVNEEEGEGEGGNMNNSNHNQIQEVDRHLESIALTANCMDEDIAEALFGDWSENENDGDDEGNEGGLGFEEILDDFVITASKEVPPEESGALEENDENYFDYDAHIAHLMKQAQLQARGDSKSYLPSELAQSHEWAQKTHDFFKDAKQLTNKKKAHHTMNDDDDDDDDEDSWDAEEYPDDGEDAVVPALSPEDEQALCSKFEEALAEYDSDEVGDLNEECEEIVGDRPLEGDAYVENALDEFLDEQKDLSFMHGSKELYREKMKEKKQIQGSSFSVLVGKRLVPAKELDLMDEEQQQHEGEEEEKDINESLMEATRILSHPKMQPPEEDVLIDGKSYFSQKEVNPWDCESILTTYSNLDNNPVTISSTRSNRRRKNKKQQIINNGIDPVMEEEDDDEEERAHSYQQIQLSNKTGLPMGVLPSKNHNDDDDDDNTRNAVVNKGAARNRKETKEEKKARKIAAKQEKMISRLEKKMMKAAFADEFMKRSSDVTTNDVGGKTVFRYS